MVESQGFAPCLVRSEQTVLLITQTLHKKLRRRGGGEVGLERRRRSATKNEQVGGREVFRIVTLGYRLERCSEKESNLHLPGRNRLLCPLNYPNGMASSARIELTFGASQTPRFFR